MGKLLKQKRLKEFTELWLPMLQDCDNVLKIETIDYGYHLLTLNNGLVVYYPTSDKLLFSVKNKWIDNGNNWMRTNLLKM